MNRGGIETWLMHVLRHLNRNRFQTDILVQTSEPSDYDDEARSLGVRIIPCTKPARVWSYCRKLRRILKECGPYDVVHSHISFSGLILRVAHQAGVPIRIVHSHSDKPGLRSKGGAARRLFLAFTNTWIGRYSTRGFAASEVAAAARFGSDWRRDPRWQVLYCCIDLEPFREIVDRNSVRSALGIANDALVMGHVGRFDPVKNHAFLLEIVAEAVRREPRVILLAIGDGVLRPKIEEQINQLGIAEHVRLLGVRTDVPRLMCAAMDTFLFPSHYEGLPLVLVEAQSAGLPCVISNVIPREADQIPELVRRLPLSAPASDWANAVLTAAEQPRPVQRSAALATMMGSAFNIETELKQLERCYTTPLAESPAQE